MASTERVTAIGLIFINRTAGSLDHWISGCWSLISGLRPLWSIGDIVHRGSGGSLRARPQVDASYLRSVWPRGAVTSYTRLADSAVRRLPFSPFGAASLASEQFHEPISSAEEPTPIRLLLPPRIPQPAANRDIPHAASCSRARPCCCTRRGDDARRLAATAQCGYTAQAGEKRNSISGVSGWPLCDPLGCWRCQSCRSAIQ